jgi:hypothetical protein
MLTYNMDQERLFGTVGDKNFDMYAVAGGGRGSTVTPEGDNKEMVSTQNPARKARGNKRGGPIPTGWYVCEYQASHPTFGSCVYLRQTLTSLIVPGPDGLPMAQDRDGFYIHGRGRHGSDGCIVPMDRQNKDDLVDALRDNPDTMLRVVRSAGKDVDEFRGSQG